MIGTLKKIVNAWSPPPPPPLRLWTMKRELWKGMLNLDLSVAGSKDLTGKIKGDRPLSVDTREQYFHSSPDAWSSRQRVSWQIIADWETPSLYSQREVILLQAWARTRSHVQENQSSRERLLCGDNWTNNTTLMIKNKRAVELF